MSDSFAAGWWLACACAVAGVSAQQAPKTPGTAVDYVHVAAPDGSRFLLVPTGGPPVVHWVMVTPAGVQEEPTGLEGLSFAVARAAMAGTSPQRSTDPIGEERTLAIQDRYEEAWAKLTADGAAITEKQLKELEAARAEAATLADRGGWERSLRTSPAVGVRLRERPDAVLLQVTTTVGGLLRVARLLVERREGQVLRGLHDQFRAVRRELDAARGDESAAAMRREVLGLSFLGHPLARAWARTDKAQPLLREQALDVFRRTHHPRRTLHVLTGGFDAGEVSELLVKVFVRTAMTAPPVIVPPPSTATFERTTVIPGGRSPAVTIGYLLPATIDRDALAVLVEWLTGGDDAALLEQLRERGHFQATVQGTAPFPGVSGGLLLLECRNPAGEGAASGRRFVESVEDSLAELLSEPPEADAIDRAVAQLRSDRALARLGAEELALQVAVTCGVAGVDPDRFFGPPGAVTAASLHALARRVLAPNRRAVVSIEVNP